MRIFKKKYVFESNIFKFKYTDKITSSVTDFYKKAPFPNYNNIETRESIINKGNSNFFTKTMKEFIGFNKFVLEAGSGTSQLSIYLALGTNNHIFALDPTLESLQLGSDFAKKNQINNISFVKADIFTDVFIEDQFDFIYCSGVLHHTKKPYHGFDILVKNLKKNGYIVIGLYNKYGRLRTYIRQIIYKYFSKKLVKFLDPILRKIDHKSLDKINAWTLDQYEHPLESAHTYDEILQWFSKKNIEFIHAIPCLLLTSNNGNKYFTKITSGNYFTRFCEQIGMIFSKIGGEGGLFIFIGKKK